MEKRQIYGVLGYPAKHSLSPAMHNAAFAALGIDAEYRIFEVKPGELDAFLRSLPQQNIAGLNVTIPYKERVIPYLSTISMEAKIIGAVNTIKVVGDKLEGYNTDGEGFLRDISEAFDFDPKGKNIAIMGAGGAAHAVAVYLCTQRPERIAIYDVEEPKTRALIEHLRNNCGKGKFVDALSIAELGIEKADLLVNATPVGMKSEDPVLVDEKYLHPGMIVYDLIYNPMETKLLRLAKKKGCLTQNGLGMLLCQGINSFKIWTSKNPPRETMEKALLAAIH